MRYPIALGQFEAVQISKGSIAQGHMRGQVTQLGDVSSFLSVCRALDRYRFGFRIYFTISSPLHEVSRLLCTIGQYDGTGWAKRKWCRQRGHVPTLEPRLVLPQSCHCHCLLTTRFVNAGKLEFRPLSLILALLLFGSRRHLDWSVSGKPQRAVEGWMSTSPPVSTPRLRRSWTSGQYFTADFNSVPLPISTFLIRCP
jgi:hypothetical protein